MTIQSQFKILLSQKETKEGRKYSYRNIEEITDVSKTTVGLWNNNKVRRFDANTLEAFCKFFDCQPGDLLVYIPEEG